jgi:hypothetical protein
MPGDPEPSLWQRLLRWWQDRRTDQRAGEGSNSVDWLEEEDDAGAAGEAGADANGNGGDGGDGGGDGGGD